MKKIQLLLLLTVFVSCQTMKIEDKTYNVTKATTEIGSVGISKVLYLKNNFSTRLFPILENKIRLDVKILPFNQKLNKFYLSKGKSNQSQSKIQFIDSLETKPEFITISLLDVSGFVSEINSEYNKETVNYLKNIQKAKIITSIALTLSSENIAKIKQADSYYLTNNQEKKYSLTLYKSNKKTENIDLNSGVVLGYELGKCCWAMDKKNRWYVADINKNKQSCKGNTYKNPKEKYFSKSLNKM